jgi:iron complex outermembrane receptor protein
MHQRSKIAVAVAMAVNSLAAYAQVQAAAEAGGEAPQRVEITGSRIRQLDKETAQPVLTMTAQQIQSTGLVSIGDVLNQLSSAAPPSFSKGATLTSNREQGGQYLDMRNLGAQRLLVLVNGKRWTQSVAGYTDMSTIPTAMVERIEVLKDGASAIYGSDAIAGVVNIILKKSIQGGNISLYKGANEKGDGRNSDYNITYGGGDEKANLMFGLSHSESGVVWAKDREITSTSSGPNHATSGLGVGEFGRIRQVGSTGAATGFNKYLDHTGSWNAPTGVGSDASSAANYHDYATASNDLYNSTQQMMFESPTELTTLFTKGTLQLPSDMRFTTTAMYSDRSSTRQNAGYPVNSLTQAAYPVYIDKDSYYNPYGNRAVGAGLGQDLFFYRRMVELPRVTDNTSKTLHIDATLEGDFSLAGTQWNWSAGYNHSKVDGTVTSTGNLNLLNLKKALGPSFLNANGVVQCGTAANPISLSLCTPFNILGGPSASNAAALAYVSTSGKATYGSSVNSATADISGEVFKLPAGAIGVAAGLEHREVTGYDIPDQFAQSGYSTDLAGNATSGRYTVKEAYAEARIPLLKDQRFAKMLVVDLASRYSDYSNFGNTTNSKASVEWKPANDLLLRGTWAQGFRAPSLNDTFGGGSQTYDTYIDLCDAVYGQTSSATVAANCAAAGVPANYRQLTAAGTAISSATGAQSAVPFSSGVGNSSLKPETSKSKTLGLVYSPSFVPGLTASLDWFDITINNRITAVSANDTFEQCYLRGIQQFCANITRDATGAVIALSRGNMNMGVTQTNGADISLNYRLPATSYGQFTVRSDSTWVRSFRVKTSDTADWQEYNGEYGYNRLKTNLSLDWSLGNWSSTFTTRFASAVKDSCWSSKATALVECSNPNGDTSFGAYNQIGSVTYSDLNIGYATPWKGKITVGANNVFDKAPRVVYRVSNLSLSSGTSVDPNAPIDRLVYVRYNQAF